MSRRKLRVPAEYRPHVNASVEQRKLTPEMRKILEDKLGKASLHDLTNGLLTLRIRKAACTNDTDRAYVQEIIDITQAVQEIIDITQAAYNQTLDRGEKR